MDKNTIIGIILIIAILIGTNYFFKPSKEVLNKQDSLKQVITTKDSITKTEQEKINFATLNTSNNQNINDTTKQKSITPIDNYGVFSLSVTKENKYYYIENENLIIKISSKGGHIASIILKNFLTWDKKTLVLFDENTSTFGFNFTAGNRIINTNELTFEPYLTNSKPLINDTIKLSDKDSVKFAMRLYPNNTDSTKDYSKYLEYAYTIKGNEYLINFTTTFKNLGGNIIPNNVSYINLDWKTRLKRQEQSIENERRNTTIYYKYYEGDFDYLSETSDKTEKLSIPVHWIAFKQQFFSSIIIAKDNFITNAIIETKSEPKKNTDFLRTTSASMDIAFNPRENEQTYNFNFYFGPNKYKILRKFKLDIEKIIPLGWSFRPLAWISQYIIIPVFNFLESFNINYGIIILILTILLKIVLFPIAYKTYMSSAKMRVLKPEIEEINKKYPKKEDALKKQQAIMTLYKKAGVNPMSGCIPMLLQLPILIAMFRFFPSSIELRQQSFLWAKDLSSYDSVLDLPFNIPFYGDHVSLFCLLMTISTIIYTKLNNDMMGSSSQQMPGMKTMMYIMPIMFLGFFNSIASGLSYYYLLANLITFAQMYAFRKFINEQKLYQKIQSNKAKPIKKSRLQQRLEEMAKNQGYRYKR